MRRINADFARLQPVARDQALEGKGVRVRRREAVKMRKRRRVATAQIREQDAASLHDGIGFLPDVRVHATSFRLSRRLQALAGNVEQPSVERAPQSRSFEAPERKVRAAMGTAAFDQTIAALPVAEGDEAFAEQADRLHRAVAG